MTPSGRISLRLILPIDTGTWRLVMRVALGRCARPLRCRIVREWGRREGLAQYRLLRRALLLDQALGLQQASQDLILRSLDMEIVQASLDCFETDRCLGRRLQRCQEYIWPASVSWLCHSHGEATSTTRYTNDVQRKRIMRLVSRITRVLWRV